MIKESMQAALEAAKKLKLGILELIPGIYALAKGEGLVKAITQTIKWGVFAAAVPIVSGVAVALFGITTAIRKIVVESGSLDAALKKLGELKALEKLFAPLLKGADAAQERVAELVQFVASAPFDLKGTAEASHSLQILTEGSLSTQAGLKAIGDTAAATGNAIQDVAGEVGMLFSQLKKNEDISATADQLQNMGVISEATARQIVGLQESGAGFSTIWARVDSDLKRSAGGMQDVQEEVGALQGRLDKARENLAAAFGKPFIDAEKTGIKNTIKTMENLRPVLAQIGDALSGVTNSVSNVKTGFLAWITSLPHLGEILGTITRFAVNAGTAVAAIGAGVFINRLRNIGGAISAIRGATHIKDIGDAALKAAEDARILQQSLLASAAAQKALGTAAGLAEATVLTRQAKLAGGKAIGFQAGAAITGDAAAAGGLATRGFAAIGRALINPWTIAIGVVAGAVAIFQSLRATHQANKQALDALNKSNAEVLHGLDEQIASITTLNDKYRVLNSTTNALVATRSKLAELKLPSDDNKLTSLQKLTNWFTQNSVIIRGISALFTGNFDIPKEETKNAPQRKVLRQQEEEIKGRQKFVNALPNRDLISEQQIERTGRRAVLERELEDAKARQSLQLAPDAASKQAILEAEKTKFTERAKLGRAQDEAFEKTEFAKEPIRNRAAISAGAEKSATDGLNALGASSQEVAGRNELTRSYILELQQRTQNLGKSYEELSVEADKQRISILEETKKKVEKQGPIITSEGQAIPRMSEEETKGIDQELTFLKQRKQANEDITTQKTKQSNISLKSESELQRITQTISNLQRPGATPVTLKAGAPGELEGTFTRANIDVLSRRKALILDTIQKAKSGESDRQAQELGFAAREESIRKRIETPNLEAEQKILSIKSEGLDREDAIAAVTKTRLDQQLAAAIKINEETNVDLQKQGLPTVAPENAPAIVAIQGQQREEERATVARKSQREDIEFQKRASEIIATTGVGPSEEISALQKQLQLNTDITNEIRNRKNLSAAARASLIADQEAVRNNLRKALDEAQFARAQSLEAAKSETTQLELQLTGNERLAEMEATRLSYSQKIAQEMKNGNTELANQLVTQGKLSIATQLGHSLTPDVGESNEDFAKRKKAEQDKARHGAFEQAVGQAAIDSARSDEEHGAKLDESNDITMALRVQQSIEAGLTTPKFTPEVALEQQGKLRTAEEAKVTSEASAAAPGASTTAPPTEEQAKELKIAASPFKEALDSSEVLKSIEKNTGKMPTGATVSPTDKREAPGVPAIATSQLEKGKVYSTPNGSRRWTGTEWSDDGGLLNTPLQPGEIAPPPVPMEPISAPNADAPASKTPAPGHPGGPPVFTPAQASALKEKAHAELLKQSQAGEKSQTMLQTGSLVTGQVEAARSMAIGHEKLAEALKPGKHPATHMAPPGHMDLSAMQGRSQEEAAARMVERDDNLSGLQNAAWLQQQSIKHLETAPTKAEQAEAETGMPLIGPIGPDQSPKPTGRMGQQYDENGNPVGEPQSSAPVAPEGATLSNPMGTPIGVPLPTDVNVAPPTVNVNAEAATVPEPAAPAVPHQGDKGGEDMGKILAEINTNIANLVKKVSVA